MYVPIFPKILQFILNKHKLILKGSCQGWTIFSASLVLGGEITYLGSKKS